jgi:hypothetical protein
MISPFGQNVLDVVAEVFSTTVEALRGPSRHAILVRARSLATYVLRQQRMSYPEIAELVCRDHTSVIAAHKRIAAALADGDAILIADVAKILSRLSADKPDMARTTEGMIEEALRGQAAASIRMDALQREVLDLRAEMEELRRERNGGVDA